MDEVIDEFIAESREGLEDLSNDLIVLENEPGRTDLIDKMFRTVHTIKGTCGFLEFRKLEKLSHEGETLIDGLRKGSVTFTDSVVDAVLKLRDALEELLEIIEAKRDDSTGQDYPELRATLAALAAGEEPESADEPAAAESVAVGEPEPEPEPEPELEPEVRRRIGDILLERGAVNLQEIVTALEARDNGDARRLGDILVATGAISQRDLDLARVVQRQGDQQPEHGARADTGGTIRVDVGILDRLMNLTGELILSRNELTEEANRRPHDRYLKGIVVKLNRVVGHIQSSVSTMRMAPAETLFRRMPRILQDTSRALGKRVDLQIIGEETELDRHILEYLADPLTHMMRNAVDHGIESTEERKRLGKPEKGQIILHAYHEDSMFNVDLIDDGRGLDPAKLRAVAIKKGIITPTQAAHLSERESHLLLFRPGFSTAEKVTNVSGRGVGMDVVRTNLEKIGGTVAIHSDLGRSTRFNIRLPLTLAIVEVLLVTVGQNLFSFPVGQVVKLERIKRHDFKGRLHLINNTLVLKFEEELLPLIHMQKMLEGKETGPDSMEQLLQLHTLNVLILNTHGQRFAVVYDHQLDNQEIVVKPLGPHIRGLNIFSGATVLGSGKISLIVDVHGLAQRAKVLTKSERTEFAIQPDPERDSMRRSHMLLVESGGDRRCALEVKDVERVFEIEERKIEQSLKGDAIQYNGLIYHTLWLERLLGEPANPELHEESVAIVLHKRHGQIALLTNGKVDVQSIVEPATAEESEGRRENAIINGRITDIFDIAVARDALNPHPPEHA